jgi:hypothetical protein
MSTQIQLPEAKPTYQKVEQALINVVKAGIYYRRPLDGKFMQNYKERVKKLCQAEDPDAYVLENAKRLFPSKDKYHQIMDDYKSYYRKDPRILNAVMDLYKLYYKIAKDYFITDTQVDEKAEDFLSSI